MIAFVLIALFALSQTGTVEAVIQTALVALLLQDELIFVLVAEGTAVSQRVVVPISIALETSG